MFVKTLLICCIFIVASIARPQGNKAAARMKKVKSTILPKPNVTAGFVAPRQTARNLEHGKFFQGDIKLLPEQEKMYTSNGTGNVTEGGLLTKTGISIASYRWPKNSNGYVIMPYKFDDLSKFSDIEKMMIKVAMKHLETYTCVRFVERTNQVDYVLFKADIGCNSMLGKIGGMQEISLQKNGCFYWGTILHEIIHALGYDHMHSHVDRDKFIRINWENINVNDRPQFNRVNPKTFSNYGTPYDYESVMHYTSKAFSSNGKDTIVPKDSRYANIIGQRQSLSIGDVYRINNMYNCPNPRFQ